MLCIAAAGVVTALSVPGFTLSWTHSVERTEWRERWRIKEHELVLVEASVEGAGAGIDLPDDALWSDGHWTFRPRLKPLVSLSLAASGATTGGWTLCPLETDCLMLGAEAGEPVRIWADETCEGLAPQ